MGSPTHLLSSLSYFLRSLDLVRHESLTRAISASQISLAMSCVRFNHTASNGFMPNNLPNFCKSVFWGHEPQSQHSTQKQPQYNLRKIMSSSCDLKNMKLCVLQASPPSPIQTPRNVYLKIGLNRSESISTVCE